MMERSLDTRDHSKAPLVELDIPSMVRNMERTKKYLEGQFVFPRGADWVGIRDWVKV